MEEEQKKKKNKNPKRNCEVQSPATSSERRKYGGSCKRGGVNSLPRKEASLQKEATWHIRTFTAVEIAPVYKAHANTELQKFSRGLSLPWEEKHIFSFVCIIPGDAQLLSFPATLLKSSINRMCPGWGSRSDSPLSQWQSEVFAAWIRGSNLGTTESPGYKYRIGEHLPDTWAEDEKTEKWVANMCYVPIQSTRRWGKKTIAIFVDDSCCVNTHIYDNKMVPESSIVGFQKGLPSVQVGCING